VIAAAQEALGEGWNLQRVPFAPHGLDVEV
jgi:hypothetical protein